MPALPTVDAGDPAALAAALDAGDACLLQDFVTPAAAEALRADALRLHREGALVEAAVGRAGTRQVRQAIRGDRTLWLEDPRCGAAAVAYLAALDALRDTFNRMLFLGLRSREAHYALYPPGAAYARHRDRFRDSDARVVSLVSYLNPSWVPADGGQLRLHLAHGATDVLPRAGTTVCFLSDVEHEVLPSRRERLSIAAWLRRDAG